MIDIKLEYEPVVRALQRSAGAMANTRPLMRTFAATLSQAVNDNFAAEGRPKWKPHAASTQLAYQVKGKDWKKLTSGNKRSVGSVKFSPWGGRILQHSGRLAASIVEKYDATSAAVGTNVIYAAIHQFGGRTKAHVIRPKHRRALSFGGIVVRQVNHPGSNIPARPFLQLTPRDLRALVLETREHYVQALARNGLMSGPMGGGV